jgi:hypothetical protein
MYRPETKTEKGVEMQQTEPTNNIHEHQCIRLI